MGCQVCWLLKQPIFGISGLPEENAEEVCKMIVEHHPDMVKRIIDLQSKKPVKETVKG